MKRALFYIAALIMLASCQQEELPLSEQALGYLSIDGLSVKVENLDYVATRAVDPEFYVKIEGETKIETYKPGEIPSEIALEPGTYKLSVYNYETYQEGEPLYSKDTTIVIKEGEVNHVSMQVPLKNVGVRLELPDGFETYFSYTFSVEQDSESKSELRDNETYYFEKAEAGNIMYSMTVTNTDEEMRPAEMGTISNPQNGNIYVVKYDYATKSLTLVP